MLLETMCITELEKCYPGRQCNIGDLPRPFCVAPPAGREQLPSFFLFSHSSQSADSLTSRHCNSKQPHVKGMRGQRSEVSTEELLSLSQMFVSQQRKPLSFRLLQVNLHTVNTLFKHLTGRWLFYLKYRDLIMNYYETLFILTLFFMEIHRM